MIFDLLTTKLMKKLKSSSVLLRLCAVFLLLSFVSNLALAQGMQVQTNPTPISWDAQKIALFAEISSALMQNPATKIAVVQDRRDEILRTDHPMAAFDAKIVSQNSSARASRNLDAIPGAYLTLAGVKRLRLVPNVLLKPSIDSVLYLIEPKPSIDLFTEDSAIVPKVTPLFVGDDSTYLMFLEPVGMRDVFPEYPEASSHIQTLRSAGVLTENNWFKLASDLSAFKVEMVPAEYLPALNTKKVLPALRKFTETSSAREVNNYEIVLPKEIIVEIELIRKNLQPASSGLPARCSALSAYFAQRITTSYGIALYQKICQQ